MAAPQKYPDEVRRAAVEKYGRVNPATGRKWTVDEIADDVGAARATVYLWLGREGKPPDRQRHEIVQELRRELAEADQEIEQLRGEAAELSKRNGELESAILNMSIALVKRLPPTVDDQST